MMFRDEWIPIGLFGAACLAGLIGAFVGLGVSSFWGDELYSAWVVGSSSTLSDVTGRAVTDLHPPVYYIMLHWFSQAFGFSDASLRLFSAICAIAAIVLFVGSTARTFSLPARLFAAAFATGSHYWFYQAQNARVYSFGLMIIAAIVGLSISILAMRSRRQSNDGLRWGLMLGLMAFGSFAHFYILYISLAVLIVLGVLHQRRMVRAAISAVTLVMASLVYLKLVIERYAQFRSENSWMGSDLGWYIQHLNLARQLIANKWALLALVICVGALLVQLLQWRKPRTVSDAARSQQSEREISSIEDLRRLLASYSIPILLIGVPVIVLLGGIVSSIILAPNFQDRNILLCSPFIWGGVALLYDAGVAKLAYIARLIANIALAVVVLAMNSIVVGRVLPRNTPIKEISQRILQFENCRGQILPIVDATPMNWTKADYSQTLTSGTLDRYLEGFAIPKHVFRDHLVGRMIAPDVRAEIERRIDGEGCPIILWFVHRGPRDNVQKLTSEVLNAVDRPRAAPAVRSEFFSSYNYGLDRTRSEFGLFILYMDRSKMQAAR